MFIIFHWKIQMQILTQRYLSYEEACLATSYVIATFHPTIGQCSHQSLSTTATPELGMIPIRNNGTLEGSHVAKDISKLSQAKTTFGFIRIPRRWESWTAKLVSSTIELWHLHQIWLSFENIYTPNTRKHPLLCYTVPRAMPSLPVLFTVCKEENQPL